MSRMLALAPVLLGAAHSLTAPPPLNQGRSPACASYALGQTITNTLLLKHNVAVDATSLSERIFEDLSNGTGTNLTNLLSMWPIAGIWLYDLNKQQRYRIVIEHRSLSFPELYDKACRFRGWATTVVGVDVLSDVHETMREFYKRRTSGGEPLQRLHALAAHSSVPLQRSVMATNSWGASRPMWRVDDGNFIAAFSVDPVVLEVSCQADRGHVCESLPEETDLYRALSQQTACVLPAAKPETVLWQMHGEALDMIIGAGAVEHLVQSPEGAKTLVRSGLLPRVVALANDENHSTPRKVRNKCAQVLNLLCNAIQSRVPSVLPDMIVSSDMGYPADASVSTKALFAMCQGDWPFFLTVLKHYNSSNACEEFCNRDIVILRLVPSYTELLRSALSTDSALDVGYVEENSQRVAYALRILLARIRSQATARAILQILSPLLPDCLRMAPVLVAHVMYGLAAQLSQSCALDALAVDVNDIKLIVSDGHGDAVAIEVVEQLCCTRANQRACCEAVSEHIGKIPSYSRSAACCNEQSYLWGPCSTDAKQEL